MRVWQATSEAVDESVDPSPHAEQVAVQLPMFNERAVCQAIIDCCAELEWPAERLKIQVSSACAARHLAASELPPAQERHCSTRPQHALSCMQLPSLCPAGDNVPHSAATLAHRRRCWTTPPTG